MAMPSEKIESPVQPTNSRYSEAEIHSASETIAKAFQLSGADVRAAYGEWGASLMERHAGNISLSNKIRATGLAVTGISLVFVAKAAVHAWINKDISQLPNVSLIAAFIGAGGFWHGQTARANTRRKVLSTLRRHLS